MINPVPGSDVNHHSVLTINRIITVGFQTYLIIVRMLSSGELADRLNRRILE